MTLLTPDTAAFSSPQGILSGLGIRVVAFTHILAGPYAAYRLAQLGVDDIIVVENPNRPDGARGYGGFMDPDTEGSQSLYHAALNSGRKFLTLDYTKLLDLQRMHQLLAGADVFLYNQRPDVMKKFGLDYNTLSQSPGHQHLLHCHISGDRLKREGAFDLAALADSGFLPALCNVNGTLYSPPLSLADLSSGAAAAEAIVASLLRQSLLQSERGDLISISMTDAVANMFPMAMASATRRSKPADPRGLDADHPAIAPFAPYRAGGGWDANGQGVPEGYIMITVGTDAAFVKLAAILQFSDEEKRHFETNPERHRHRDLLRSRIETALAGKTADEWQGEFSRAGIVTKIARPISVVVQERADAGTLDRHYIKVVTADGEIAFLRSAPGAYSFNHGTPTQPVRLASAVPGKDNQEIFAALKSGLYFKGREGPNASLVRRHARQEKVHGL